MAMPRRRPLEDPSQYYAYVWRLRGIVLWVGQGKNNRGRPTCKACWNGRPRELKELLLSECRSIDWEVFPCSSKKESEDLERTLINKLKPKFNKAPQKGGWKGMHSADGLARIGAAQIGKKPTETQRIARSLNAQRLNELKRSNRNAS